MPDGGGGGGGCSCCGSRAVDTAAVWKSKWGSVVRFVRAIASGRSGAEGSGGGGRRGLRRERALVFDCLLQLYAHESFDEALARLDDVYERAPPALRFHLPQLCNFLLRGRMPRAERLETLLLDKCERSMHFAHRMYFFLNAFAFPTDLEI